MELPWRCKTCGHENMIDPLNLESWPLDKIISAKGFICEQCDSREVVNYYTVSLLKQEDTLIRYPPTHPKFKFLFAKVLKKAEGVNARGEALDGEIGHQNLATP